jgi:hypothetical protein
LKTPPNKVWESDTSDKPSHSFIGVSAAEMKRFCKVCGYELQIWPLSYRYPVDGNFKGSRFNIELRNKKISKVWVG